MQYLNTSLIIKFILKIYSLYESSFLKKIFVALFNVWQNSYIHKHLSSFFNRNFNADQSITWKVISKIASIIDWPFKKIYKHTEKSVENSFIVNNFNSQKLLYILPFYLIIDYAFRTFAPSSFLTSYWDELILIAFIALWIFNWIFRLKKPAYKLTPLDFPIALLVFASAFILIVNTNDKTIGFEGFRAVIQYVLWFLIAVQLLSSAKIAKNILVLFILLATALSLHGIYQYVANVEIPSGWVDMAEEGVRTRAFSIIGSPNILGSLMTLIIPIALGFTLYTKKVFNKLFFLGCAASMSLCLIFTMSKGAWIGFGVAIIVFALLYNRKVIIPVIALGLIAVLFIPPIRSRISYMLSPEYIFSSNKGGRLLRWKEGLELFKNNFLMGKGLGRFGGAVAMNHIDVFPDTFYMDNYYLKTAVEMGIIGLTAFLVLVWNSILWGLKSIKNIAKKPEKMLVIGCFSGMCGILAHNAFENIFEVPYMTTYFWIIAAIVIFFGFLHTEPDA